MTFTQSSVVHLLSEHFSSEIVSSFEQLDQFWQERIQRSLILNSQALPPVIYPRTQEELSKIITLAAQQQWRILTCGGGSKLQWGGVIGAVDAIVSTAKLNALIEHAVGDLTVTVEAGIPLKDLQATLTQAGQFLAINPAYPDQATLGGMVATADTGSWRHRYGSVRDMLLGITFVRADGELVKAGGRVVKNVAGYDLMKLMNGSFGTLGAIAQLTFRLYPLPEADQTVILLGEAEAIFQAQQKLLSSALTPVAVDLLSPQLVEQLNFSKSLGLLVSFRGIKASVVEQSNRLLGLGKSLNLQGSIVSSTAELEDKLSQILWQQSKDNSEPHSVICKIGVLPSEAVRVLVAIATNHPKLNVYSQIHLGSGLGLLKFEAVLAIADLIKIRDLVQTNGGFLSVLEAPIELKQKLDVWGYSGNALRIMQQIKQKFDPQNLFSPNRFLSGI